MSAHYHTCLLIDDNYIDNFVTRRILEGSHFADDIVVTSSAAEAIGMLRAGRVKPDVIFLDIRMPQMGGFEFLQEYDKLDVENKSSVRIFMLSSSLDPTDFRKSINNKYITHFLHKPLTQKALDEIAT